MKSEKLSLSIREIKAYTPDRLSGVLDNWRKFQYDTIMLAYGESVNREIEVNDGILQGLAPLHNVKDCSDMNELLQLFTSELNYDSYNALADSLENNLKKTDEVAKRKVLEDATQKLENQDRNEKERLEAVVRNENERIANIGAPSGDKLNRLSELGELLKSGAISKDEFDGLKKEIMISSESENIPKRQIIAESSSQRGKEKVSLQSFHNDEGSLQKAPEIEYLNLSDISDKERKTLKTFIRKKQIFAPEKMTQDEITIGNKLFTAQEIAEANSERSGFNYASGSIISVLASGAALYFITISLCFIVLGAGGGMTSSAIISFYTLTRADATKLDKTFSMIALGLIVIAFMVYGSAF